MTIQRPLKAQFLLVSSSTRLRRFVVLTGGKFVIQKNEGGCKNNDQGAGYIAIYR